MTRRIRAVLLALSLAFLAPASEATGCEGDFNGDGVVTIDEVIRAVVNGLEGCPPESPTPPPTITPVGTATPTCDAVTATPDEATPTPTPTFVPEPCVPQSRLVCAQSFLRDNTVGSGRPRCAFVGNWNPNCGTNRLVVGWASDGFNIVFALVDPPIFIGAQAIDRNNARLTGWWTQPDRADFSPWMGTAAMTPETGFLQIAPIGAPFSIGGCPFEIYTGRYFNDLPVFPAAAGVGDAGGISGSR